MKIINISYSAMTTAMTDNQTTETMIRLLEADKQANYWQAHGHSEWSHSWAVVAKTLRQSLVGRGGRVQVVFPTNPHPEQSDEKRLKYRRPAMYQGVSIQLGDNPHSHEDKYREHRVRRDSSEDEFEALGAENDETRFWKH